MSNKLEIMVRNLKELERRAAMHGPGQAPLFLLNQIEDLRREIRQQSEEELVNLEPADSEQRERIRRVGELVAAVQPGEGVVEAVRDDIRFGEFIPFVLQLSQPQDGQPQVRVQHSWAGETGPHMLTLPYEPDQLTLVLKALATPVGKLPPHRFTANDTSQLQTLGLVEAGYLLERVYQKVGRALYQALFPQPVEILFQAALTRSKEENRPLAVRLIFDAETSVLAVYPWELIYSDVPLVADGLVDLTRYIAFPGPQPSLEVQLPLRVLIISARPSGLAVLPNQAEPEAIMVGLQPLARQGMVELRRLATPTREALIDYLRTEDVHLIHFDGHGSFGRLCPTCHILHTPTSQRCIKCEYPLSTVAAQGYLAFEDADRQVHYVSARVFANALTRSQTRVVMLSACQSGQVGGEGVFSGVGASLIQAGVPAVAAMQLAIPLEQAIQFARSFYTVLAEFRPLVEAVGRGRQQLYGATSNPQAWFVPTLYLRSDDPRGKLFKQAGGEL